jgi:3-deoxy-D-manno-octulosonic-acid transferase
MNSLAIKTAFWLYNLSWQAAIPMLRLNSRLRDGFAARLVDPPLPKADIWIQAASGGEAYLGWEIIKQMNTSVPRHLLLTTNTRQGIEIFEKAVDALSAVTQPLTATTGFCPFDRPAFMEAAMQTSRPRVLVLLESEIWPAMMRAARRVGCPSLIINGRMTQKSLKRYLIWPSFWRANRPTRVMAISTEDAARFARLFGHDIVSVMPNIKFDRFRLEDPAKTGGQHLDHLIPPQRPMIVLGSVRKEEETAATHILAELHRHLPQAIIGLFPRHMHRISSWQGLLNRLKLSWILRSDLKHPITDETVVLWNTFGELNTAYARASAAFIGGSLAPLGGQNFLEALMWGVVPVIGPYWDNFAWVGRDIFEQGLVQKANGWQEAADMLISKVTSPPDRLAIRAAAQQYIRRRQGGTAMACRLIEQVMTSRSK